MELTAARVAERAMRPGCRGSSNAVLAQPVGGKLLDGGKAGMAGGAAVRGQLRVCWLGCGLGGPRRLQGAANVVFGLVCIGGRGVDKNGGLLDVLLHGLPLLGLGSDGRCPGAGVGLLRPARLVRGAKPPGPLQISGDA
eukprot:2300213-Lingulodinium_polyedra.AAC.1